MRPMHVILSKKKEKEFFFVKIENRCSEITYSLNVLHFLKNTVEEHNNCRNQTRISAK